ncbi:hypothetical protein PUN28_012019 [Cardiocondyla obscurior]|uniref:Uncharacterized protein n=1 Tax=Cardiocondyla obscurior TaxID=286306 RepID=A0AAW2FAY1_9HYME
MNQDFAPNVNVAEMNFNSYMFIRRDGKFKIVPRAKTNHPVTKTPRVKRENPPSPCRAPFSEPALPCHASCDL